MVATRNAVRRGRWTSVTAVLVTFSLSGTALAQTADPARGTISSGAGLAPPPGALIAPGESPGLVFLHTGYVVGFIEPCG